MLVSYFILDYIILLFAVCMCYFVKRGQESGGSPGNKYCMYKMRQCT